ncbi:tetratricopeptide repeat protein [Pseudoalteromonas sp.]|uniref:tetratricopeptide repeat protein n=1 Tax=Pseudoalteromonas sp. TaxID=53249 RepID=UPI003568DE70
MSDKLNQAITLISQKKFKKALVILKKINKKEFSFIGGELEASCLFNEKKFKQSELLLKKLDSIAQNNQQKSAVLSNLAAIYEALDEQENAIESYKKLLSINTSPELAQQRKKLCFHLLQKKEYEQAIDYSVQLKSLDQYYANYLLINFSAYKSLSNEAKASENYDLFKAHLSSFTTEDIILFTNALFSHAPSEASSFLEYIEQVFGQTDWITSYKAQKFSSTIESEFKRSNSDFPKIECTSQQTETLIAKLCKAIIKKGGYISPNITIKEHANELSIHYNSSSQLEKKLIELPAQCCPVLSDYNFHISNDYQLSYTCKKNMLNKSAQEIMDIIIALYNQTEKLKNWAETNILMAIKNHKDLLSSLLVPFKSSELTSDVANMLLSDKEDDFLIESFFTSRKFNYNPEILKLAGIKTNNPNTYVLMPIVDLLNHKLGEKGYQVNTKNAAIEIYQPNVTYSDELFVQYNLDDPCITLFLYGFIDDSANFYFSIPLQTSINDQNIQIENLTSAQITSPPSYLGDYKKYYPKQIGRIANNLLLSQLALPQPNKLKRFLAMWRYLLSDSSLPEMQKPFEDQAVKLSTAIYTANLEYWLEMERKIASLIEDKTIPNSQKEQLSSLAQKAQQHFKEGLTYLKSL